MSYRTVESKTAKRKREAFEKGYVAYTAYANTHLTMLDLENEEIAPGNKTYSETEEDSWFFHIVRILSVDLEKGIFTCHEDNGSHTSEKSRAIIHTLPLRCIKSVRAKELLVFLCRQCDGIYNNETGYCSNGHYDK